MPTVTAPSPKKVKRPHRRLKDQQLGYCTRNKVELVNRGKEFFDKLKELIDEAEETIHIQTYIFGEDQTGQFIANALMEAARRKVRVYLMVDGYASQKLSREFQEALREAGVHFRFFQPFFRSRHFYFGRRLHHKIVAIDSRRSLVGSMNIANKYNDTGEGRAWFDMAVYIEGDVSEALEQVCRSFWKGLKGPSTKSLENGKNKEHFPESYQTPVRVRQNDWIKRKGQATSSYYQLFHTARESITVVCSYVLPGKTLRRELKLASMRGVKIKFVLAGNSDVGVVKAAERYLYRWMFRHDMKLFEYQPTVLHTKMGLADGELMTIGSYNLNNLSAYASVELNLDIKDADFVSQVQKKVNGIISRDCTPVDLKLYTTHLFSWKQLMRWMAYHITRVAELLITKK